MVLETDYNEGIDTVRMENCRTSLMESKSHSAWRSKESTSEQDTLCLCSGLPVTGWMLGPYLPFQYTLPHF